MSVWADLDRDTTGLLLLTTATDDPLPDEVMWAAELLGTRITSPTSKMR